MTWISVKEDRVVSGCFGLKLREPNYQTTLRQTSHVLVGLYGSRDSRRSSHIFAQCGKAALPTPQVGSGFLTEASINSSPPSFCPSRSSNYNRETDRSSPELVSIFCEGDGWTDGGTDCLTLSVALAVISGAGGRWRKAGLFGFWRTQRPFPWHSQVEQSRAAVVTLSEYGPNTFWTNSARS